MSRRQIRTYEFQKRNFSTERNEIIPAYFSCTSPFFFYVGLLKQTFPLKIAFTAINITIQGHITFMVYIYVCT